MPCESDVHTNALTNANLYTDSDVGSCTNLDSTGVATADRDTDTVHNGNGCNIPLIGNESKTRSILRLVCSRVWANGSWVDLN